MNSLICNGTQDSNDSGSAPEFLYKYYSLNEGNAHHRERIFTHNELYFPSPSDFNDPFDSKIRLEFKAPEQEWKRYLLELYKAKQPEWNREQRLAKAREIIRE